MVQKISKRLMAVFMFLTAIPACLLRFYQLYSTGESESLANVSYAVYALLALFIICAGVFASKTPAQVPVFEFEQHGKKIFISSIFVALSFFADFIHQGYNCYVYIQSVSYIERIYISVLILNGLAALICSFYFLVLAFTANGANYDFRNFSFLHFTPALWGFVKLFEIMLEIVDVKENSGRVCEFITIVALIGFAFCLIVSIDRSTAGKMYVLFALILSASAFTTALPHLAMMALGKAKLLENTTSTMSTYIMLGVFCIILVADVFDRGKEKIKE